MLEESVNSHIKDKIQVLSITFLLISLYSLRFSMYLKSSTEQGLKLQMKEFPVHDNLMLRKFMQMESVG